MHNNNWNYHRGIDGIPFRTKLGSVPFLKPDDPNKPVMIEEARVDRFDLSNEEHVKEFQEK